MHAYFQEKFVDVSLDLTQLTVDIEALKIKDTRLITFDCFEVTKPNLYDNCT